MQALRVPFFAGGTAVSSAQLARIEARIEAIEKAVSRKENNFEPKAEKSDHAEDDEKKPTSAMSRADVLASAVIAMINKK